MSSEFIHIHDRPHQNSNLPSVTSKLYNIERRELTNESIERFLEYDSDEDEIVGGAESDSEPDEITDDFHHDESSSDSEDNQTLASLQARTSNLLKVFEVPTRLYGANRYKWSGETPQFSGRTPRRNIILHPPGNKGPAKQISTCLEAWSLFFDEDVLGRIVSFTNAEITLQRQNYNSDRQNYDLDEGPGLTYHLARGILQFLK
ncbi:unnamed protein product [Parnassius apollo]|uniref:(apollo) hypothetical protein n=1 Tax=Parnassius apollo TaxID=110799 RepID=A0A8S3Y1N3_PARAO|nr:unnamed protein product [Parnassius apollo]